jgi:hypothetical protein
MALISAPQIFDCYLTSDNSKRIGSASAVQGQHQSCKLEELLGEASKLQQSNAGQRSVAQQRIEDVITAINQHARVIDVLIQQQPDITSIIWGAFRCLIGVRSYP